MTTSDNKAAAKVAKPTKDAPAPVPDIKAVAQGLIGHLPEDVLQSFIHNSQILIREGQAQTIAAECKAKMAAIGYQCNIEHGLIDGAKGPTKRTRTAETNDGTPAKRTRARHTTGPVSSGRGRPTLTDADEKYDGKKVAKMLKAYKREHGLTLSGLAEKCDVSIGSIVNWMNGSNYPTGHNLAHVAKLVGL